MAMAKRRYLSSSHASDVLGTFEYCDSKVRIEDLHGESTTIDSRCETHVNQYKRWRRVDILSAPTSSFTAMLVF